MLTPHYIMVCTQIHAPTILPKYFHMHLMNKALRRQPAILETWYVYFAMLYNRGPFITFSRYVSSVGNVWHAVSHPKQTESLCDCRPRFDYEYRNGLSTNFLRIVICLC